MQHVDQKPESHRVDSCWGIFGLFFRASYVTDYTNISSNTRVPGRFNGIRDFLYLKLVIRDFKAKSGKIRDWKYACELECPKYLSGLRDCSKLWVGITGLHEIVGRDHGIEESYRGPSNTLSLSFISSLAAKTIFTVKLAFSSMSSAQ